MRSAEQFAAESVGSLSWAKICERYPNEWVCLLDVVHAPDGSIQTGRVGAHDPSMRQLLAQFGASQPDAQLVHTAGRPLGSPRLEMTDEIRDIVRSRR
jgi:hypothetical protein